MRWRTPRPTSTSTTARTGTGIRTNTSPALWNRLSGVTWLTAATASAVHSLQLGLDLKDLKEDVLTSAGSISTPLRYAPLQLAYTGSWWGEAGASQQWSVNTTFEPSMLAWKSQRSVRL